MRKTLLVMGLAFLAFLLIGSPTMSQQAVTPEQMAAWQAVASTYYAEGVDENAMLNYDFTDIERFPKMWLFTDKESMQPGMYVPDFTLLDVTGYPYSLSDFRDNTFVVVVTGSWY